MGVDGQHDALAILTPAKRPSTHLIGGWVNQVVHNLTTMIYRID